jgi:hypothetical protein
MHSWQIERWARLAKLAAEETEKNTVAVGMRCGTTCRRQAGGTIMTLNDDCPDDDSFNLAFREYREQTSDPADFADLPADVQCDIVERACRIKSANDLLKGDVAA